MSEKSYTQKVDEWLIANSGCTVLDCCIKFGYYPIAIKIMGLDDSNKAQIQKALKSDMGLKDLYLKYANDEGANARKGKNRNWTTFFQDMITGWVLEDLVIEMFKRQGLDIRRNGKDFQRVIDIGKEVSQEADCIVTVGDVTRKIELSNEFNDILDSKGYIEKRAPAIHNLWKNKVIWLYRELSSGKYVLVDFAAEKVKTHLRYHQNWDKDVHRYILEENSKKVRDDRLLAAELITVVGCSIEGKEQTELEEVIDEDSRPHEWDVGGRRKKDTQIVQKEEPKKQSAEKAPSNAATSESSRQKKVKKSAKPTPPSLPPKPLSQQTQPIEEDPDMMYDSSADTDSDGIDWNAVAMANSEAMEF